MISVIIATFNSGKTLDKCLKSVLNQSNNNFEIIIKDGGSSDNTCDIISKYNKQISFFESSKDLGVYDAWNICIQQAKGDWLLFLGSDDFIESNEFFLRMEEILVSALNNKKRLVYGKNRILHENGEFHSIVGDEWKIASIEILNKMTIRHPGCFHHISLFREINGFDVSFKVIGDHHFILRALRITEPYFYPFIGVTHLLGGLSTNPILMRTILLEKIRMRKQLEIKPYFKIDTDNLKKLIIILVVTIFGEKKGSQIIRKIISRNKEN